MIVLYRDKSGRFISKKSAKHRKPENVRTELREKPQGKSLRIVKGYHVTLRRPPEKKRKRKFVPAPPIRKPVKRKAKIRPPKLAPPPPVEEEEEEIEEFPEEFFEEPEERELTPGFETELEEWVELEDQYTFLEGLDYLDDIFDYPADEDWYEET